MAQDLARGLSTETYNRCLKEGFDHYWAPGWRDADKPDDGCPYPRGTGEREAWREGFGTAAEQFGG